jgi:hypothetical protein
MAIRTSIHSSRKMRDSNYRKAIGSPAPFRRAWVSRACASGIRGVPDSRRRIGAETEGDAQQLPLFEAVRDCWQRDRRVLRYDNSAQ